ncbi:Crp/Fnr family transcriptional regulator [Burkholderiaceae bacterium UC74_6]
MKPSDSKTTDPTWMAEATIRTYRRGQTIIEAGAELGEWVAISSGAACLMAKVAGSTNIAVAALWLGDVIGWNSPLGKLAARYEVNALVDVVTINIPRTELTVQPAGQERADTALLHAATETRLQDQISMRLAGNGFQRLVSVLATLATALAPLEREFMAERNLALPVGQACIGQLSGLSRRQTWIYLGQLAEAGWLTTNRTRVVLQGLSAWLQLMNEVETNGLGCIATVELCSETLSRLG